VERHSPVDAYPEYAFAPGHLGANEAYALVRRCLQEFGAGMNEMGSTAWNPLSPWIKPGDRVFVLPNFVTHRRPGSSLEEFQAKCTHGSVIRAVLDYASLAAGNPHLVAVGNAPLQSCDYPRVAAETGAAAVARFYHDVAGVDVGPHDLRLLVAHWTRLGAMVDRQVRDPDQMVAVDLGEYSLLDELFGRQCAEPLVRVGDYPPEETMVHHGKGQHVYLLHRRVLEADVIVSVPKLKTHQKVGITCALKGTVGTIARKECLAHHRRGGPENGGDEYPRETPLRHLASALADRAATRSVDLPSNLLRMSSRVLTRLLRIGPRGVMGGGWAGNDTAWRMALDIARILRYARFDGTLSDLPVRRHIALVDGIVAGEGEGPLKPRPRRTGTVLFSPDVCAADVACALIMGYDPAAIPLIANSFRNMALPLTDARPEDLRLILDGQEVLPAELRREFAPPFHAPKGWRGAVEAKG
jgi:uncharacterized protein (DUF362 family)